MNLIDIIELLNKYPVSWMAIGATLLKCVDISPLHINPWLYIGNICKKGFRNLGNIMNQDLIDQVNTLSQNLNDLDERFNQRLDKIENENDQRRIKDCRREILDFASSLQEKTWAKDDYEHVYDIHEEYEKLLEKHNLKNGHTTRAMHKITKYYQKHIENGDF
ncbi:hypothetical protein [Anaerostipes faecalis]|uniref:hypothetical protein n=1 Tax=Anaerostipes faecalis TaxID=2738446 RepID=UPI003F0C2D71